MKNIDKIVKKCECISFDIFDTLICRKVSNPHDIFKLVQDEYNNQHIDSAIDNFEENRIEAEIRASKRNAYYTLDAIYDELDELYGKKRSEIIKELEIDMEKRMSFANPEMKEIFDYIASTGKEIILISDMYLTQDIISQLLNYNGYSGWSSLFISCECGASKRQGTLFKYVLQKTGKSRRQICHFGDNLISDYVMAIVNGFRAIRVK